MYALLALEQLFYDSALTGYAVTENLLVLLRRRSCLNHAEISWAAAELVLLITLLLRLLSEALEVEPVRVRVVRFLLPMPLRRVTSLILLSPVNNGRGGA